MFFAKKPNKKTLNNFREGFSPEKSSWQAFEMNQNFTDDIFESYRMEYHHNKSVSSLNWAKRDQADMAYQLESVLSGKKIFKGELPFDDPLIEELQISLEGCLHRFFKEIREKLVECGRRTSQGQPNLQEGQGYEWLRVSLEILKKALDQVAKARQENSNEVCSGLLFCGTHPTRNQFIFRLRLFNLDLEAVEDEKGSLRVQVLDKKNQDTFAGVEPSMKNVFHTQKAQVIDLLIQCLPKVALAIMEPPKQ